MYIIVLYLQKKTIPLILTTVINNEKFVPQENLKSMNTSGKNSLKRYLIQK